MIKQLISLVLIANVLTLPATATDLPCNEVVDMVAEQIPAEKSETVRLAIEKAFFLHARSIRILKKAGKTVILMPDSDELAQALEGTTGFQNASREVDGVMIRFADVRDTVEKDHPDAERKSDRSKWACRVVAALGLMVAGGGALICHFEGHPWWTRVLLGAGVAFVAGMEGFAQIGGAIVRRMKKLGKKPIIPSTMWPINERKRLNKRFPNKTISFRSI